ncbi:MAG: DoxX family membrane protein [Bacteroidales bacterium]|nr:DoxX family membrane protein [Bacteroidales bacterium]
MTRKKIKTQYSTWKLTWLVTLRVMIGWHFLYEGMVKVINPNWSSVSYLLDSSGVFKGMFYSIAANPDMLRIADFLNIWGLITIGLGLILGAFTRVALWSGIVLMGFYYLSHPPFIGLSYSMPMEGSYLIVNKVLIELMAMIVLLVFPTSQQIGLDRFIFNRKK